MLTDQHVIVHFLPFKKAKRRQQFDITPQLIESQTATVLVFEHISQQGQQHSVTVHLQYRCLHWNVLKLWHTPVFSPWSYTEVDTATERRKSNTFVNHKHKVQHH